MNRLFPSPYLSSFLLKDSPALATTVNTGLCRVEEELERLLTTPERVLDGMVRRIVARPAKRLRPFLAILGCLAAGHEPCPTVILGAAAAEALHLASLLHDDVIDGSPTRGGEPTANATLGNSAAVLLGDFFFARALRGAAAVGPDCLQRFLGAAEALVGGEFGQCVAAGRMPTVEQYYQWIDAKTGRLFALAVSLGQDACTVERMVWEGLSAYGRALGLAFQLRDDLKDMIADERELGKPTMNDCRRGFYTYPAILACAGGDTPSVLFTLAKPENSVWRREVADTLRRSGALAMTMEACRYWASRAQSALSALPSGAARQALARLAEWVGEPKGRDSV